MNDNWLHRPKDSWEFKMYELIRGRYESFGYFQLGCYNRNEGSVISCKQAIKFWGKARLINILLDRDQPAKDVEYFIGQAKQMLESKTPL